MRHHAMRHYGSSVLFSSRSPRFFFFARPSLNYFATHDVSRPR
jgi:hypothetical protein